MPAFAAVPVRGGMHADYNRLVFDFPRATEYEVEKKEGAVTLTFKTKTDFDITPSARKLARVGNIVTLNAGEMASAVAFGIPADGTIKHFLSGNSIVVDIRGNGPPSPVSLPVVKSEPEPPSAPASESLSSPAMSFPATETDRVPETDQVASEDERAIPDMSPSAPLVPSAILQAAAPLPAVPVRPEISLSATPAMLAKFDPRLNIPAAIYERGDYVYVAFDRRLRFDTANLFQSFPRLPAEVVPATGFSIYRIPMPLGAEPIISKQNTSWQLDVVAAGSDVPQSLAQDLSPRSDPLYSLGARVVIPLRSGGPILSFIDPVAGDTLFLIPAATVDDHLTKAVRFADFELLPSLQGIVIRVLNDSLAVRMIEEGVEITSSQGLRLGLGDTALGKTQPDKAAQTVRMDLIPLMRWQQPDLGDFIETRQALQQRVAESAASTRDRARIDLVRFYLSYGNGYEALGILDVIAKETPEITGRPEFQLLRALGAVLSHQPEAGLQALGAAGNADRPEIRLWRAAALAEQRKFQEASADFNATLLLLENYPSPFAEKFAQLAAETFIAVNDNVSAARMIDLLVTRKDSKVLREPSIIYLRGVMQARDGAIDQARKLWQEAAKSTDYLARVRSEMALVDLEVSAGNMSIPDAVKKLEGLRFAWRGDELEMEMLSRLAGYQLKAGQPTEAIETLERAKKIFPNSAREEELLAQQRVIFRDIFGSGAQDNASPLQTLALFDQYKDFSPTDPVERLVIINDVVDKMMTVDLLPQAIALLEPEIANMPTPALKNRVTLRLAALYLLNGEPAKAEDRLKGMDETSLGEAVEERKLLLARSLTDRDRHAEALALLANDMAPDALRLTSVAAWRAKDWPRAAAALGGIMPPTNQSLSDDGAQLVLQRAVALSLAGDTKALEDLDKTYAEQMRQTSQAQAFAIIAKADITGGAETLARVQEQAQSVDLFQGFLDNYRKTSK
ncbi:MAG: hypothetical protein AB7G06_02060 [Bdellovibrionales bacterium]